ncbi:hypothetical protein [Paenibacillus sabinae]|uniref:Uncharacterized protein n=1 Tax=Paenibacillus sabinae T27 TaxID=1268072 RepID=X4ZHK7_9BACL|nr:hypothetical protein [Paenibacillus sabinae]AHV99001.1 hypothetical protein PSAB_20550 [Paenibacillus sabinae T27]
MNKTITETMTIQEHEAREAAVAQAYAAQDDYFVLGECIVGFIHDKGLGDEFLAYLASRDGRTDGVVVPADLLSNIAEALLVCAEESKK